VKNTSRWTLLLPAILALVVPDARAEAPAAAKGYRTPPLSAVHLTDEFWRPRLERNQRVTIPHILRENVETGRVANFERAAGRREGPYEGRRFNDTDIYKVVEAASYALESHRDPALSAELDELIDLIAAAQEEDGYLMPARTVDPQHPAAGLGPRRWIYVSAGSHELYNAGHLIEAAVAHFQATGKRSLLEVAVRLADRIDTDFGPEALKDVPGHEEIELALVKLADATGERRYLALAKFFLDSRGSEHDGEPYPADTPFAIYNDLQYRQDDRPVTDQTVAVGHAVRATYLYTGMADVAARLEAPGYEAALERVWRDLVSTKLYLTGGIGARDTFESFGEPYELPNATAYTETCAAIGNDLWNHRMFRATGRAEYLDVVERILYNGFLSGVSLAGDTFFYTNPLASNGGVERSSYFEVACCPANLARMMAQLPTFLYAYQGSEIVVALYAGSEAELPLASGPVRIRQDTAYPWSGSIAVTVDPGEPRELTLTLRIPGWSRERPVPSDLYEFVGAPASDPVLWFHENERIVLAEGEHAIEGGSVLVRDGLARIRRTWRTGEKVTLDLPLSPRRIRAHPDIEPDRGRVALQRGPLVYAFEGVDNGSSLDGLILPDDAELGIGFIGEPLGGVQTIRVLGNEGEKEWTAIPYFAWANRGASEMAVWVKRASEN
jgi:uncharacterized protein